MINGEWSRVKSWLLPSSSVQIKSRSEMINQKHKEIREEIIMKPIKTTEMVTGIISAIGFLVVVAALILRLLEVIV